MEKKNIAILILLFCIFAILQTILQIFRDYVPFSIYKGVFSSIQYGLCLLMIYTDLKRGTKLAIILMSISIVLTSYTLVNGTRNALPGIFNILFYLITLIIIARYDYKKEIESRTDLVTNVSNRKGLYLELQEKISKNIDFNVIYVSLNNFKSINDSYGHAYGDELLRMISKKLEANCGEDGVVARFSGAEFVVLINGKEDIQKNADKLLEAIREKSTLVIDNNKVECYIDGFAGVSNFPKDSKDYESLIKYADIAMTEALSNNSKQAYLFNSQMLERINRQMHLKNLIKEGLVKDYFYLVYQPQFVLNEKKLRGFETLIRMKTAEGEFVSPGEFIPVAEKSDLILQIDDYVLERAMREFKDIVLQNPELTISVNVSARNFASLDFVEKIKKVLSKTQFSSKNLEIEITEYCMVNSIGTTTDNINSLRELGIQIALDDFGTGYTSLNYVASLPIDLLKIDKSLIDDIENDKKRRDFVKTVITMGQLMECEVISEGVENDNQINCLKEDGCNFVQGFVWGKPLMYEDAKKLSLEEKS